MHGYLTEPARSTPVVDRADVVVCGGGPAGVAAAVAAARDGADVRLIESQGCLGGVWTAGLLTCILDKDGKPGFMAELLVELDRVDGRRGDVFDPEAMKRLLERLCLDVGVRVRLHTRVVAAARDASGRLSAIVAESKSGREAFAADVFIDCTGDGDVAALAGCGFEFGEPGTGRGQPMSLLGLFTGLARADLPPFDIRDYRENTDWMRREIERGGFCPSYSRPSAWLIRDGLFCLMANHAYGVTGLDADQLTHATLQARAELHEIVRALHRADGRWATLRLVASAEQIGVREGRRVTGRYVVTRDDLIRGARHDDAVCRVTFPVDIHALDAASGKGLSDGGVKSRPYDIPYRALVAQDAEGLLLAGRCISGDFFAHASYRVTGNAVAMGEAAGRAAAMSVRQGVPPHRLRWGVNGPRVAPMAADDPRIRGQSHLEVDK